MHGHACESHCLSSKIEFSRKLWSLLLLIPANIFFLQLLPNVCCRFDFGDSVELCVCARWRDADIKDDPRKVPQRSKPVLGGYSGRGFAGMAQGWARRKGNSVFRELGLGVFWMPSTWTCGYINAYTL